MEDKPWNLLKALLALLFGALVIVVFLNFVSEQNKKIISEKEVVLKEYKIVGSFSDKRIDGEGHGGSSLFGGSWEMKITEKDEFIFYYYNKSNNISKKTIPNDFEIIEFDEANPKLTLNEKQRKVKRERLWDGWVNEVEKGDSYYKLYVPKGKLKEVINWSKS